MKFIDLTHYLVNMLIQNNDNRKSKLDLLFLTGVPLREPVVLGGPMVMNTERKINDAVRQLQDGTFLNRDVVLREHAEALKRFRNLAYREAAPFVAC